MERRPLGFLLIALLATTLLFVLIITNKRDWRERLDDWARVAFLPRVLATVNAEAITKDEVVDLVHRFVSADPKRAERIKALGTQQAVRQVVNQLVMRRLLVQEAERLGITVTDEEIQRVLAQKSQSPDLPLETAVLGGTLDRSPQTAHDSLLIMKLGEKLAQRIMIYPEEIQEEAKKNKKADRDRIREQFQLRYWSSLRSRWQESLKAQSTIRIAFDESGSSLPLPVARTLFPPEAAAVVNGEPISRDQLDLRVRQKGTIDTKAFQALHGRNLKALMDGVLNQMIETTITLQEARRENIEVSDAELNRNLNALRSRFKSEAEFVELLRRGQTTPEIWREDTKNFLIMKALEERQKRKIKVDEDEIREFWDQNKYFLVKSAVKARHILLKSEEEAVKILEALKKGERFEDLVKRYSTDQKTRDVGGELGWLSTGQTVKEFEKVAFSLKPGELSPPVKTPVGFHIIQVEAKKEVEDHTLEEHREHVLQILQDQKWALEEKEKWITSVKERARIWYNFYSLATVGSRPPLLKNRIVNAHVRPQDLCTAEPYDGMHQKTLQEALRQRQPVVILFSTPGLCRSGECPLLHRTILQLKDRYAGRVSVIHIDVAKEPEAADIWGLRIEPSLFLLDRDGVVRAAFSGDVPLHALEEKLTALMERGRET